MRGRFRHVIRRMRLTAGLSQQELAARLATTQSAIARWETGEVSPRLDSLERIAEACKLDAQIVWTERDPPAYPSDRVVDAYKRDVDRTLLRENLKLSVEQRLAQHRQLAEFADKFRGAARKHK